MMIDRFHRKHDYLRISLTDRCNLRCTYCMPDEDFHFMDRSHLMQAHEIESLAKSFVENGVTKIRLTGGEPLARPDFADILQRLSTLGTQLTITTNAVLLHRYVDVLQRAGVQQLNISLDTLSADKFMLLTRRDKFHQTKENIQTALHKGFEVKINMVVMRGINDHEVLDFIAWTKHEKIEVRFIEFMPFDGNHWESEKVVTRKALLDVIQTVHHVVPLENAPHATSTAFKVPGFTGSFAIISTMSHPFCGDCNRMRLTADGKMKNCLFSKDEVDLLTALRNGLPITPLIHQSIANKAEKLGGQFGNTSFEHLKSTEIINRSMISIGG
ncbi:cyclic pyranopterin phosphate synthase [Chitinophaga skermanii]|uniref:GTP 3',8-cyclase n=1 Tax=Chitinophaga skermanii TaxID=331697 RepID=A0A327Q072_9BACT|nr:GTP 3',8-cyclase MoaA [Chitinophaga skermanii]RAI97840.1 cyclic pyranopterin phosphate synthase [Chitinophaga skermanii]